MPIVALMMYKQEGTEESAPSGDLEKSTIAVFLTCSFTLWLLLNIAFFCTIDLSFLNTFIGTKTGWRYTCERFLTTDEDFIKYDAVFVNRISYTKSIHGDVKIWIEDNIDIWRAEKPEWFNITKIPDEFLPEEVFVAEGGQKRRRSSVSMREIVGSTREINK